VGNQVLVSPYRAIGEDTSQFVLCPKQSVTEKAKRAKLNVQQEYFFIHTYTITHLITPSLPTYTHPSPEKKVSPKPRKNHPSPHHPETHQKTITTSTRTEAPKNAVAINTKVVLKRVKDPATETTE